MRMRTRPANQTPLADSSHAGLPEWVASKLPFIDADHHLRFSSNERQDSSLSRAIRSKV